MEAFTSGNLRNRTSSSLNWVRSEDLALDARRKGLSSYNQSAPVEQIRTRTSVLDVDHRWQSSTNPVDMQQHKLINGLPRFGAASPNVDRQMLMRQKRRMEQQLQARERAEFAARSQVDSTRDQLAAANREIDRLRKAVQERDRDRAKPASRQGRQRIRPSKSKVFGFF